MRSPDRTVTLAQLLAALAHLAPLEQDFYPVGVLAQEARDAIRGDGGLTASQMLRLQTWSARWKALQPRLRALYSANSSEPAVQAALWTLIVARNPNTPSGRCYARLSHLWIEMYGYPPSIELVPWMHLRALVPNRKI